MVVKQNTKESLIRFVICFVLSIFFVIMINIVPHVEQTKRFLFNNHLTLSVLWTDSFQLIAPSSHSPLQSYVFINDFIYLLQQNRRKKFIYALFLIIKEKFYNYISLGGKSLAAYLFILFCFKKRRIGGRSLSLSSVYAIYSQKNYFN